MDAVEQRIEKRIEKREGREYFTLDRCETFYYWQHLVRKPFVLVNQKTSFGQMPRVAYFFPDPDEDKLFPMMSRFRPFGVAERASQPAMHALRIELPTGDLEKPLPREAKIKFTLSILQRGVIDGWADGFVFGQPPLSMFASPIWQAGLWERIGLQIPPSREMKRAISDPTAASVSKNREVTGLLKEIDKRSLVVCMLGDYWSETKADPNTRTWHISHLFNGMRISSQGLSQYEGLAGLKQPTRTQFIVGIRVIVGGSESFFKRNPEQRMDAEEWEQRPVCFLLPGSAIIHMAHKLRMERHRPRG